MKSICVIKEIVLVSFFTFSFSFSSIIAQSDTMYIMKSGETVAKFNVNNQLDSIIFYKPTPSKIPINIVYVNIPGGTFTMGSPTSELERYPDEVEYQVTLSDFRMSKYEISNAQFAAFLNDRKIDGKGRDLGGAYPIQTLIYASSGSYDWGLHFNNNKWEPVPGYENHPVINVTWYGATEFATYSGAKLPTEAQWEYACRGNTTTPFYTGNCLTDIQANYNWAYPYSTCVNTTTTYPGATQAVGSYPANSFGLHDMHGNVWEWCSDWYGMYPTSPQINPKGPTNGALRVNRSGGWYIYARHCRSANRNYNSPENNIVNLGFRVVLSK